MSINQLKIGKRFMAGLLATILIGSGFGAIKLHKDNEVKRVKNYLEDFLTDDNYVDFSKISKDYDIKGFSGEVLVAALQDMDIDYVRIIDSYIYDDAHVETFRQMTAVNYENVLGIDDYGNTVYEMYEPIRSITSEGIIYVIPDGYTLEEIDVIAEPIRYNDLTSTKIVVTENDFDNSYSLELRKK